MLLNQLIRSVNLLPIVQTRVILDVGGLESLKFQLVNCTQTPDHIRIASLIVKLLLLILKHLDNTNFSWRENKDNMSQLLNLIEVTRTLSNRDKFPYKFTENSTLLSTCLKLFIFCQ